MVSFDFFLPACLVDSEQRVGGGACGKQTHQPNPGTSSEAAVKQTHQSNPGTSSEVAVRQTHQSNPGTSSDTAVKISELCYFTFFVKNIKNFNKSILGSFIAFCIP